MRTLGRWPPEIVTSPTPASCDIFGASAPLDDAFDIGQLAASSTSTPSVRMGASAGLTLA